MKLFIHLFIVVSLVCGIGFNLTDTGTSLDETSISAVADMKIEMAGGGDGELLDFPSYLLSCGVGNRIPACPSSVLIPSPPLHPELRPPIDRA